MSASVSNNVAAAVLTSLSERPEKLFLVCENEPMRRREFRAAVAGARSRFGAAGVGLGTRVLVATGRGNQVWRDMVALWSLGAVAIPVEPEAPGERLSAVCAKASPEAVAGRFRNTSELTELRELAVDGSGTDMVHDVSCAPVASGALSTILFTSGSTGEPKGVMLAHRSVLGNALATRQAIGMRSDDRLFMAIPFRFVSALSHFMVTGLLGATLIATERLMLPADFCYRLLESGATAFGGSPVQARWIAEAATEMDFTLRWLMSSGDHLPVDVIAKLRERLPETRIVTAYGLTEVGGRFCVLNPDLIDMYRASVGQPIPNMTLSVLDEDGKSCPPGEIGEVYVGGACVFDSYIGDSEATAECLSSHGFRTGDLGHLDEQGYLYLSGRADDVFKSAGLKVSSLPIQAALMNTGCFRDVAVLPAEDPVLGYVPHAYHVPAEPGAFDKSAVLKQLRGTLPGSQIPTGFTELSKIPRTGSGKVDRKRLRQLIEQLAASKSG